MLSTVSQRGRVPFPEFTTERIYMRAFTKTEGLPPDLSRWQPTIEAMLDGVDVDEPIYLMVDQTRVHSGVTQRRPGLHVDGYWDPVAMRHKGGHIVFGDRGETLMLASSVFGGRAYVGEFDASPGAGGDCEHIPREGLTAVDMEPGYCWSGHSLSMLHESVPVKQDCYRTLVRLNVPGLHF